MREKVIDYIALEDRGWKIIFFLMPVAGLALLWLGWQRTRAESARENWPRVSGIVTAAQVTQPAGGNCFAATLHYRYFQNDSKYEADRVGWRTSDYCFEAHARAADFIAAHPESSEVSVHFNPDHPEESYLFAQPDPTGISMLAAGGLLLALFILTEIHHHTRHEEEDIDLHLEDAPAAKA